jgi:hypothetical protein
MKKICDTSGIPCEIFEFPEDSIVDVAKVMRTCIIYKFMNTYSTDFSAK